MEKYLTNLHLKKVMSLSDENSRLLVDSAVRGLKSENVCYIEDKMRKLYPKLSTCEEKEDQEIDNFSKWRQFNLLS